MRRTISSSGVALAASRAESLSEPPRLLGPTCQPKGSGITAWAAYRMRRSTAYPASGKLPSTCIYQMHLTKRAERGRGGPVLGSNSGGVWDCLPALQAPHRSGDLQQAGRYMPDALSKLSAVLLQCQQHSGWSGFGQLSTNPQMAGARWCVRWLFHQAKFRTTNCKLSRHL
jgi:hypothetical protein